MGVLLRPQFTNGIISSVSFVSTTITGYPAISVAAGFTDDGLPVGIQDRQPLREDFGVLQIPHALEQATDVRKRRPAIAS